MMMMMQMLTLMLLLQRPFVRLGELDGGYDEMSESK